MKNAIKALTGAAVVLAIGGISLTAIAQPFGPGGGPGSGGYGPMGFMHGGGPGMMHGWGGPGFGDATARLDALKARLAIRPEQTAAWDSYVKALQDSATQMQALRTSVDFDSLRTMNWQEHQAFMARMFDQRAQAYKSVQAAANTLFAALDDKQKAQIALPELEEVGPGAFGWHGGPMMGSGYGMMPWGSGGGSR